MQLGNTKLHIRTIILSALPLLILIAYIALMGLDIPFWDQWEMVPLLAKMKQGSLTFADLFSQHNEHRPFFPRLLWLMAAQLTGYNTTAELWMNLDITLVTFGAFSVYSAWVGRTQRIEILNSILPVATLLVFNLAQWESWLMGFQTVMFLGMLAVVMGFIILSRFNNWYGLLGGALLGSVATFSIASATLYWPIGFLIIIALSKPNNRLWRSAIWLIVSALILSVFFRNWSPSNNVSWDIFLQKPVLYFNWVLNFLGAPLLRYRYAWIFGIISLIWIVVVGFRALRTTPASLLTPYWAIIGFILISALTIGIGRSSISIRSSLASRYLTLTVWYWVSLLALLPLSQLSIRVQRLVRYLWF